MRINLRVLCVGWLSAFVCAAALQAQDRTMFVLDRSTSMDRVAPSGATWMEEQADAVALIAAALPSEHMVGIVSFGSDARLDLALTPLMNTPARQAVAVAATGLVAQGGSVLGDGLDRALAALIAAGPSAGDESIVLITDGADAGSLREAQSAVLPELVTRGVRVYACALEAGADLALLDHLAASSGGRRALPLDSGDRASAMLQFLARYSTLDRVHAFDARLAAGELNSTAVALDASSSQALFVVAGPRANDEYELEVVTPSRLVINAQSHLSGVVFESRGPWRAVRVSAPEGGTWQVRARASASRVGVLRLRAEVLVQTIARSTVNWDEALLQLATPGLQDLFASATGFDPLAPMAMHVALIDREGITLEQFEMHDDGCALDGDATAGDGRFGARFGGWPEAGEYRLRVCARGSRAGMPRMRCADLPVVLGSALLPAHSFLRPLRFDARVEDGAEPQNELRLALTFDLPPHLADPRSDDLHLTVGGLEVEFPAGSLQLVRGRYVFVDEMIAASLDLGIGGSSKADFDLTWTGFDRATLGDLERVELAMTFGVLELSGAILPQVLSSGAGARWKERNELDEIPWQVLACQLDRLRGSLKAEQRIGRDLFDPSSDDLELIIAGAAFRVPAGSWTGGPRRYRFTARCDKRSLLLDLDLSTGVLRTQAKGLQFFGSPAELDLRLKVGAWEQRLNLSPRVQRGRARYGN